ncbi:MAG: peptidase M20 [Desulfuromonas sp.]|nr:MAG: peptidase M20 [Desulfuromonas sp.]
MVNTERLCKEFLRQASIASPPFQEGEMADYLAERFRAFSNSIEFDDTASRLNGESGNLLIKIPGTRPGEPLLLSVHMDTVTPCLGVEPILVDGVFRSAGETVLGADDKAGITEIIETLEIVREQGIDHPPLEILITVCEEVGLLGAKHFDCDRLESKRGIALDTNGTGKLIYRAPGANKFRITITGLEAHAGMAPEKGVSAIETAARAISRMRLGRIDEETTANIGLIEGGQASNIVPRQVVLAGEVRSHDGEKLQMQTDHILHSLEAAAREMTKVIDGKTIKPVITTEVTADYPIMHVKKDAPVIQLISAAATTLGQPLKVSMAGGGSDANIFNDSGIETVILSSGMENVHTSEESVSVADLTKVTELLVEVIRTA